MHYGGIEHNIISSLDRAISAVSAGLNSHPKPLQKFKVELEAPKGESHGDLSTNIAMKIAREMGQEPYSLANLIKEQLETGSRTSRLKEVVERIETRPPGFINFFLSRNYLCEVLLEIERKKDCFGRSGIGRGARLQVEFVSANPTGPLTIAHGRQAAIGDSLANILDFVGYNVTREYYMNDLGTQMDILANSIRIRYLESCGVSEIFPEDGYKGSYIMDIAKAFNRKFGRKYIKTKNLKLFREFGLSWILNDIKKDLKDFGVRFDVWYSESSLRKSGKVENAVRLLKKRGYIYEKDKAIWFKSQAFGDDKDRVVFKSDGSPTYLAPDIAYHLDKYRRGFKRIIDIWGPDHHGYIPRIRAAVKALGYSDDSMSVLIVQLATLIRGGEAVSMSTRAGEYVTLRQVMDEVGKDVARFCFLMRRLSSHLDFDLDAVKVESQENPVYYIQYAHARIWSLLEHARKAKLSTKLDSRLLKESEELELLRTLRRFPNAVSLSADNLEPYIILQYLQDLATTFHSFYTKHKVVSDDLNLSKARLVLVDCVRIVLANGLCLLGVSLPKKM
ncbi:MAG: arginine--tRNA ligase [Candidatus Omnitrophica bacterium]|nr:arginine--tRNA ligase [Candidatus Omnitrophota bacterium]